MLFPLQRIVILKVGIVNYSDSTSPEESTDLFGPSDLCMIMEWITVIEPTYRKFASTRKTIPSEKVSRPKRDPSISVELYQK